MLCKPYKLASINSITQGFGENPCSYQPNGHTGVDFVAEAGTFLVAPETCRVINIIDTSEKLDTNIAPLERGYGILMQSIPNPGVYYVYFHCSAVFPVKIGDMVYQGQIVAEMSNSGLCMSRGVIVPIDIRSIPPYLGTHLHAERFTEENGKRVYTDITKYIDWNIPVNYSDQSALDVLGTLFGKILNIIKGK